MAPEIVERYWRLVEAALKARRAAELAERDLIRLAREIAAPSSIATDEEALTRANERVLLETRELAAAARRVTA